MTSPRESESPSTPAALDLTSGSRISILVIALYLSVYLAAGLVTELGLTAYKPLPDKWLDDFTYYQRALSAALSGNDPYEVRTIGPAFLYPPPALLVVELFSHIQPFGLLGLVYSAVNIALLGFMVYGIARRYGYSLKTLWWWFPLALGFAPLLELLHVGQINLITEFGIFLMFWGELSAPWIAGFGLSLAIMTKVTPILFLGYLFVNKRFKVIAITLAGMMALTLLALLRYGPTPFQIYPEVFRGLLATFPLDLHSQSLVSKLTVVNDQFQKSHPPLPVFIEMPIGTFLAFAAANVPMVQQVLSIYLGVVLLVSGAAAFFTKQREPFFVLVNLGMLLSPNIMWYHHYIFILLPFFVWMAWARFKLPVVLWCLIGLLLIQIDRFRLTTGLLIHGFAHLTILIILMWQLVQLYYILRPKRQVSAPAQLVE